MRAIILLSCLVGALGCSYVEIPVAAASGTDYLIARSMELGNILNTCTYEIALVPRNASRASHALDPGHVQGTYGYICVDNVYLGLLTFPFEGMNEKGLTVSALEFRGGVYEASQPGKRDVDMFAVLGTLLSACDSVNCSVTLLDTIRVTDTLLPDAHAKAGMFGLGLHWAITDVTGRSVAVEYLKGQRVVYENTPRVFTNDPELEWQWKNLNTYDNLSPNFPHQNDFLQVETSVGAVPRAVGHGWNLFGLPGDSSPPSRFVNLFYLREYAVHAQANKTSQKQQNLLHRSRVQPSISLDEAIVLGTDIMDRVVIPEGSVAGNKQSLLDRSLELTDYDVLKIPTALRYIIRAHKNSQWREIDLSKLNFTKALAWPLEDGTFGIKDITADGKPKTKMLPIHV